MQEMKKSIFVVFSRGFDEENEILGVFSKESFALSFIEEKRKTIIQNMKGAIKRELKLDIRMNEYQKTHQKVMKARRINQLVHIVYYSQEIYDNLRIEQFQVDENE